MINKKYLILFITMFYQKEVHSAVLKYTYENIESIQLAGDIECTIIHTKKKKATLKIKSQESIDTLKQHIIVHEQNGILELHAAHKAITITLSIKDLPLINIFGDATIHIKNMITPLVQIKSDAMFETQVKQGSLKGVISKTPTSFTLKSRKENVPVTINELSITCNIMSL